MRKSIKSGTPAHQLDTLGKLSRERERYVPLQDMLPHFADPDGNVAANRLLHVICSRARKILFAPASRPAPG